MRIERIETVLEVTVIVDEDEDEDGDEEKRLESRMIGFFGLIGRQKCLAMLLEELR